MKYKPSNKRVLSVVLSLAMLLGYLPSYALATEVTSEITEVTALREENVKHYDMGDGTFQAVAFSHPIHELDENGAWQDIDFGLDTTNTSGARSYSNELTGSTFTATYTPDQPIMTLSGENSEICMTLDTSSSAAPSTFWSRLTPTVTADVTTAQPSLSTPDAAKTASFSNKLLYEDVLPGVDLEYVLDPGMVKENIIVKEKLDDYEYIFTLDLDGLYPVMQGSGSIVIYNSITNVPEYEIPAPYMYDALGNMSTEVFYTLSGTDDTYTLTVTADADWINAEDRSFPITIDPSYLVNTAVTWDTYIDSDSPSTAHGADSLLYVRSNRIAYIRTSAPSIPDGATLNWAKLTAYYYYFDYVSSGSVGVSAHRVMTSWSEARLNWDMMVDTPNYGLSTTTLDSTTTYGNIGATVNSPEPADFYITSAVRGWLNDSYENYGIALKYMSNSVNRSVVFKSYESSYDYRARITYAYSINGNAFHDALVDIYGFSETEASMIENVYEIVAETFPNNSTLRNAWISSRLLGGLVYSDTSSIKNVGVSLLWADVAGTLDGISVESYLKNSLGYTDLEYTQLKNAMQSQHNMAYSANNGDFAHMQISLAARLAYELNEDNIVSNIFGDDETVSYLAGWLGDATVAESGGTVSFGNDDYIADLDAENIFRLLLQGSTILQASVTYYESLETLTRAQVFTGYISYSAIKYDIYYELIDKHLNAQIDIAVSEGDIITVTYLQNLLNDEEYHAEHIASNYPDTHDFLYSIADGLNEMGNY